jgi:hypothetical protein
MAFFQYHPDGEFELLSIKMMLNDLCNFFSCDEHTAMIWVVVILNKIDKAQSTKQYYTIF